MKSLNLMKPVLLCFSAFMLHALEGQGKGYYVSAAAGDGGDGTHVRPFKDIQAAATLAEAGDTVYVTGGLYVVEGLKPGHSGSEGRFVVFRPLPGTGEVVVRHPDVLPGDYSAVFDLSGLKYVWLGGFTFRDFKYAKCAVSRNGSEGGVVSRCRFERLGHPEVASWNANSVIWMGNARGNSVVDNVFEDIIGDGVSINGQQCNGNLVARNSFTRFSGKKRSWGGESLFTRCIDVQDMSDGNNAVAFNYFTEVPTCIWLDRDGSRNILLRNRAHACRDFIFNESRCTENMVSENIGANLEGIAYQTARYETGWTADAQWTNNVAFRCKTGFFIHKSRRDRLRNNIVYDCSGYNVELSDSAYDSGPHVFLDNLVYTPGKTKSLKLCGAEMSLRAFQTRLGGEGNLEMSPGFVSTTYGQENFTLKEGSRAKGYGYGGVDLGAYPVYGAVPTGPEERNDPFAVQAGFDAYASCLERGAEMSFTVRLSHAYREELRLALQPVAGEARAGEDFILSTDEMVFLPGETAKSFTVEGVGSSPYDELLALRLVSHSDEVGVCGGLTVVRIKKNMDSEPESVDGNVQYDEACRIFFERGSGKLKVEWPDEKFTVGIYRHDGRLVHSDGPADGSYVWDMNRIHRGLYIVNVKSRKGTSTKTVCK